MRWFHQLVERFAGGSAAADPSTGDSSLQQINGRELNLEANHVTLHKRPEFSVGIDPSHSNDRPMTFNSIYVDNMANSSDSLSCSADSYHSVTTNANNNLAEKSLLLEQHHETCSSSPNDAKSIMRGDAEASHANDSERLLDRGSKRRNISREITQDQIVNYNDDCFGLNPLDDPWLRRAFSDSELYYRSKIVDCIEDDGDEHRLQQRSYSLTSLRSGGHPLLLYDDDDADEADNEDDNDLQFPPPLVSDDDALNDLGSEFDAAAYDCGGTSQRIIQRIWKAAWQHTPFQSLPQWLQDNNYLRRYHRPQIQSVLECFRTIFRIHSETGNIWTHMLGCLAFLSMLIFMWVAIEDDLLRLTDKLVLSTYFFGALLCMAFSFLFHTLYCHSDKVGRLFGKLDYCGIACMIVGSFIPWLHYSFYCHVLIKWFYISAITLLAALAITVSLWNRFGEPKYRWLRAGLFLALGLSALVPSGHYLILEGAMKAIECAGFLWLMLMAFLYVFGAILYAVRVPERFFPGRFDIFMHSHQIFHCMVIAAAFVHYHGIMTIMVFRMTEGACEFSLPQVQLVAVS